MDLISETTDPSQIAPGWLVVIATLLERIGEASCLYRKGVERYFR